MYCDALYLHNIQNKQLDTRRSLLSHNFSLFPYTLKVLLAEVKIFVYCVISFTFATQKSMSKMPKQNKMLIRQVVSNICRLGFASMLP